MRDRKAFEEDAFGKLWQADTCYLPHILENGHRRRVYCIMIIDDHSRLLVGSGLFYNDNTYNLKCTPSQGQGEFLPSIKIGRKSYLLVLGGGTLRGYSPVMR